MQLENFEKFTATERIEHQQIDRYGMPGPSSVAGILLYRVRSPVQESIPCIWRRAATVPRILLRFPTSLATTGLNGLGVSILQPAYQGGFIYKCEGLTSVRAEAAWQIRFEENHCNGGFHRGARVAQKWVAV